MADSKINEKDAPAGVVSVTDATPAEADKVSEPNAADAQANQPPVRTNRPDVPIAQVLSAGAGQHRGRDLSAEVDGVEVDSDGFDRDGRFVGEPSKAKSSK